MYFPFGLVDLLYTGKILEEIQITEVLLKMSFWGYKNDFLASTSELAG